MAAYTPNATALLMNRSFAQFRRSLCVMVGALALVAALSAPAHAQAAAVPELTAALQAVNRADQADADQYAPELLDSARIALAQAQAAAASRRDRKLAPELALRATVDAELARARSNEAMAQAQLQRHPMPATDEGGHMTPAGFP